MFRLLVRRSGLLTRLRQAWKEDVRDHTEPLRGDLKRLTKRLDGVGARSEEIARRMEEIARRVEVIERHERKPTDGAERKRERVAQTSTLTAVLNAEQQARLALLPTVLHAPGVVEHVRRAIAMSPLLTDPYPHVVVEKLFPDDVYRLLLEAIPPPAFFGDRDPIKQNLRVPMSSGPDLAVRAWHFFDEVVAKQGIQPALVEKFGTALADHYEAIFGAAFRNRALALPIEMSGGRLMLRRPGYHLAPHRDPKRSIGTCLLYFARPGDSDVYGTGIYRVLNDDEASYTQTFYPEQEGRRCELVKMVPYRPNTMLAFLNSRGAHGATIPKEAPADLERYTCQYYLGPDTGALRSLIDALPPERQARWRSKEEVAAM